MYMLKSRASNAEAERTSRNVNAKSAEEALALEKELQLLSLKRRTLAAQRLATIVATAMLESLRQRAVAFCLLLFFFCKLDNSSKLC